MQPFFKTKTFRSKKYLAFVRGLPCSILDCGNPAVAHHVYTGGVSMKCSDAETIPLCIGHHDEVHLIGKETFYQAHNTTIEECLVQTMQRFIEEGR